MPSSGWLAASAIGAAVACPLVGAAPVAGVAGGLALAVWIAAWARAARSRVALRAIAAGAAGAALIKIGRAHV